MRTRWKDRSKPASAELLAEIRALEKRATTGRLRLVAFLLLTAAMDAPEVLEDVEVAEVRELR